MPSPNLPPGFDFTDPDIYAERLPIAELAEMRKVAPIWWNEQPEGIGGFGDGGYWVVTKHKDVKEVSRRSDVFSSQEKTALPRYAEGASRDQIDASRGIVLLNMDAPHHTHLRKIISRAFTPRAIELLRADLAERARDIAAKAAAEGSGDFVEQVSCELPLQAIAGLMGVPQDERKKLFDWSNQLVGDQDPEFASNDGMTASAELMMYGMQLAAERADSPAEDLVTKLIQADVEGHKLSDDEFGFFVIILAVAGNETTRNSITQGMMAFTDHPDQWELFKKERPATAADEIVRWATPVTSFQRTALEDTELGGVSIKKGQRVVMFYRSANFDEEVFDNPYEFDILRDPNPHVGFGGTGAHYCIGANLARMTIDLMFNAIADAMPDLTSLAKPERLRSGWLNGIKHWQVDYSGESAGKQPVAH
ncbi:cytochrome P450 [Mycobacterium sp. AZCC_0083]|jgi:cholest-4-en-3-one 26-monooxygenase|uniref:cytochrome P450 n=1 Tax=Mycobacterium sp. AZCC_0083 TaxID=2735882 RepID=UPI00160CB21E|nr:cytochrome P450 [Mycobacterium sp. AZCC_0083]MBB5161028.1 cholest-4-en-3-one 26-monooxygenase [Mycobacterium sp. AZCC_0083]MCU1701894.1 Cytochrome P450-like protein [Mycobacterium sp.]